jgi:outer membrane protein insertion porin family
MVLCYRHAPSQSIYWTMKNQMKYVSKRSACALAALAFVANAWAVEPFTVSDIRVEGLQRVEPGTVFASLPFRVGESYSDDKGSAAIRSLFALGLFKDVRIDVQGNVLVVIVEERPTVADVSFTGTKEFDKEALTKSLREVGINEGRPFDKALADRAEQELKRQYINRSLYGAEVVTTVTPIERNRVNLNFNVIEGDVAKIKEIRVVGAKVFSESTLLGLFDQDTSGWLSWYTKSDRYARTKLNADLESLRSYYLTRGYLEFKIDSTQVAISPDKQDITLTINITEGERYYVSGIKLEGNCLNRDDEFKTLITVKPGEPYNSEQLAQTTKAFSDYFGTFGYAFAQVQAKPEIDRVNNRVSFVIQSDPSRRAYVRKINIGGNVRTRDEIIRREFRQFESSWYDGDKIKLSRDRVDRLGYFKEVNVETVDVPGASDQIDLIVTVVEKPTGNLQLGAGFSSAERLSLQFKIAQENVFGTGTYLGIDVNTSKSSRQLSISSVDPYFTNDGVSRAVDVYYRSTKPLNQNGGDYQLVTTGASLRFGIPFTELDTVFFGGGVENTKIKPGTNIPAAYLAYANEFGYSSTNFPLTLGWSRDSRDSAISPNTGVYQRVNGEWGVAGDARYLRSSYQGQYFYPINKKFTIALNGELGWGKGLSNRAFPVFKNFTAGGLGSVRGFDQGSLGPRDVTGSYIGGAKKIIGNIELLAPFPGVGNDKSLRLFGFVDAGNVFGEFDKYDFGSTRVSTGVGISWISPVGPLRLAYARPVRKFPGDRIQKIQFQIGTSF